MLTRQEIAPTTGQVRDVQVNCTEADKVLFSVCGTLLTATDTVSFFVANSTGGKTPVYLPDGNQAQLTSSLQSLVLEGGFLYVIDKAITAAASGVDSNMKPRQGT